jgi:DNA replication and repair protein RecF
VLSRLTVRNFRNLAALDLDLPSRGVVLIGANGQGKTNLLEAVYYLVLFRSFRGANDRELVRFGTEGFFVGADIRTDDGSRGQAAADGRLTAGYDATRREKKVTADGKPVERLRDTVGRFLAVTLSPADRTLVSGGPAERRRYLDVLLSLSAPAYLESLSDLRAALRQRNAALRAGNERAAWAFDVPFAKAAAAVASRRIAWVRERAVRFTELSRELGEAQQPAMAYQAHPGTSTAADEQEYALAAHRERDLKRGTTTVGPHRDDLRLTLDGRETRRVGSAGQQRTAAVALRLLEAASLTTATGRAPVALFDDVFAELDADRQGRLLGLIEQTLPGQAIVTAPRASEVPAALSDRPRWTIAGGEIAR